jgi:hypothetical protein
MTESDKPAPLTAEEAIAGFLLWFRDSRFYDSPEDAARGLLRRLSQEGYEVRHRDAKETTDHLICTICKIYPCVCPDDREEAERLRHRVPALEQRHPPGCPDPDWCAGNAVCYWGCTRGPYDDLCEDE